MKPPSAKFQSVVKASFNIALELQSGIITSAHILSAILQSKEDETAQAILRLTTDSETLKQSIRSEALTHGKDVPDKYKKSPRKVPQGSLPMSDEAETIIVSAMKVSAKANVTADTCHIVVSILDNHESLAYLILKGQLDVQQLRSELAVAV
ncbi:MAG: hypothetical protein NTX15_10890 [Candidatus Kapabacteria bacterium]|nr:hypothetical protein [Candidatus Kapabacteria bacterium]